MASPEAKAKWLHLSNRYTVDEDYARASSPPTFIPSSSKLESEKSHDDKVASNDSPSDTKWWLYQQHEVNHGSFWNPQWVQNDTDESNKLFSEMESQWIGIKKNEPWWRTAGVDDMASFVSHKSLEHFDNCDLPLPQRNKTRWLVCEKGLASLHQEPNKEKSSLTDSTPTCTDETQYTSGVVGCSPCGLDKPYSSKQSDEVETPYSELSKAQLLEALCHSQKRARDAEKAAQQACNEKEHMISLFLKQASQIFAYKQWLYILQLETLKNQPVYTKGKVPKRRAHDKATKRKHKSVGKFLWGLALVGAGVLLGWNFGWLFPAL